MPEDIAIRPIHADDDAALARIVRDALAELGAGCAAAAGTETDALHASYTGERRAFFVAVRGDEVLGGAGIRPLEGSPGCCELRTMYLRPAARGEGIGRRLLERCLQTARALGFTRCCLETMGAMTRAREVYRRAGFTPLDAPFGGATRAACDAWYAKDL